MAAKLIVALAFFALCNASPVYLRSYLFRNGRGYSVGQGYTNNAGGRATGSATINGGVLQAFGSASTDDQNQQQRSGAYGVPFPGEAVAKAEVYDTPGAKAVAEAKNTPTYFAVPEPATIISEQSFKTPVEIRYEYGAVNTAARTQGVGSASSTSETGLGLTSAATQTNGGYASSSANNALNSAVVSASSQGTASSKADINNAQQVLVSPVKIEDLKVIGWRFGTAYSVPTPGQAQVSSQVNGGSAKSTAQTDGVVTNADAQGYGSANANANLHGGYINSAANTNGFGYGAARNTENNQYGSAHSTIHNGLGNIKTSANSNGYGAANSHADINEQGSLSSASNSNGRGTAASSANSVPSFASLRGDGLPYVYSPQTAVNTQTSGQGSASARTQGVNTGYKVINSVANSSGNGSAQANASA